MALAYNFQNEKTYTYLVLLLMVLWCLRFVLFFVCFVFALFVCLFACLFVCLFGCSFVLFCFVLFLFCFVLFVCLVFHRFFFNNTAHSLREARWAIAARGPAGQSMTRDVVSLQKPGGAIDHA